MDIQIHLHVLFHTANVAFLQLVDCIIIHWAGNEFN